MRVPSLVERTIPHTGPLLGEESTVALKYHLPMCRMARPPRSSGTTALCTLAPALTGAAGAGSSTKALQEMNGAL